METCFYIPALPLLQKCMHTPHSNLNDKRKRLLFSQRAVMKLVNKVICHDINLAMVSLKKREEINQRKNKKSVENIPDRQILETRRSLELARSIHHSIGKGAFTRIQNRCVLSGRSKAVYRFCRISRIRLQEMAGKGLLNGVTKSSW